MATCARRARTTSAWTTSRVIGISVPGTYYAVVDGYTDTDVGPITVSYEISTPAAIGDLCTSPTSSPRLE